MHDEKLFFQYYSDNRDRRYEKLYIKKTVSITPNPIIIP